MSQNASQYMTEESIGKLMLRFSISYTMSLLVSTLYNIVGQIFIGRGVESLGNGATNVVFPIAIIALAISPLVSDGCAAYLSICQGRMDAENAHKNVGNAIGLITVSGILLTLMFTLFRDNILAGFGATVNNIEYAREYFSCLILGIPFFMFANSMDSITRADGSPQFAIGSTLIGCIINVILDPVAIFIPGRGMKGAALATIAGRIVSALLAVYYLTGAKSFRLKPTGFLSSAGILKHILSLGISSFLTQIFIVAIMAMMNNVLVLYEAQSKYGSDIPLTMVGIVMKAFQIVISIAVGITTGIQPIVGYNYSAGLWHRVKCVFHTVMIAEFCVGLVSLVYFEAFPIQIISLFGSEDSLYNKFVMLVFRIFLSGTVLCCLQKTCSIFLQSIGRPALSMVLSLLRDLILGVPLTLLLPKLLGVTEVLHSGPVADVATFGAAVLTMGVVLKELMRLADESEAERHRGANTAQAVLSDV